MLDCYTRRGYLGKGMVVTLDKFTAVRMYDKVQHHWKAEQRRLLTLTRESGNEVEKARFKNIGIFNKAAGTLLI